MTTHHTLHSSALTPCAPDRFALGWTATQAVAHLSKGDIGAVEYLHLLLSRQEQMANLRCFTSLAAEQAEELARQADRCTPTERRARRLHGLPIAVKDNIDVAGLPTSAGSPALMGHVPRRSASVIAALQREGAIVIGKNNMHEFALGVTSNNAHHGAVRNPWQKEHMAGGSSGGTAAAVAAQIVPLGIGTDTGGSVRIPASMCGVVGWRPSTGRWGCDGIVPISHTRDTPGPITRSVADCLLMDEILTGRGDARTPPPLTPSAIRLGVPRRAFWDGVAPDIEHAARTVLDILASRGVTLVPCAFDDGSQDLGWQAALDIALHENLDGLRGYWTSHGLHFDPIEIASKIASPDVRQVFELLRQPQNLAKYQQAMTVRRTAMLAAYNRCMKQHRLDALVFPTLPIPAGRIGEDLQVFWAGRLWPTFPTYTRNAVPATLAGVPAITLPAGSIDGLPWGLELDGLVQADHHLLRVARTIETLLSSQKEALS